MENAIVQERVFSIGHWSNAIVGGHSDSTCIGDFSASSCEWDVVVTKWLFGIRIPEKVRTFILANPSKVRAAITKATKDIHTLSFNRRQTYAHIIRAIWSVAGGRFLDDDLIFDPEE